MRDKKQFVSIPETNSSISIYDVRELIVSSETNISSLPKDVLRELVSIRETIYSLESRYRVFLHLCREKAGTYRMIHSDLPDLSKPTIYRTLEDLTALGVVEMVRRIPGIGTRGRMPRVYKILGAEAEDVMEVCRKHQLLGTPGYREALRIKQLILDEFLEPKGKKEITKIQIIQICKDRCSKVFNYVDIADIVARELNAEGIRVWM